MGYVAVLAAAAASWVFGAIWYMVLSKPWVAASGIEVDENGRPKDQSPLPFIISAVAMILVAGMMRHVFAMAEIDTLVKGIMAGAGIGAFLIAPWQMINNAYGGRPFMLTVIDAGYAIIGCTLMGIVLTLL